MALIELNDIDLQEKAAGDVGKFTREVYQQCVDKGWSVNDFRLFVQLINLRKESVFSEVSQQVRNMPLPSRRAS